MDKFFVVVNSAKKDTWAEYIWKDIEDIGEIFLDNNILVQGSFFWKLKKLHFSNRINRYIKLPFKSIWNKKLCIQAKNLNKNDTNYIIFQGSIKFSPQYIKYLKKNFNVVIILYLYDTIVEMGIGKTRKDFFRYCNYYYIDMVFSFDYGDCKKLDINYFDLYSSEKLKKSSLQQLPIIGVFYIGTCRSKERLELIHKFYEKFHREIPCEFYLVGVNESEIKYPNQIHYNEPLNYSEVLKKIEKYSCLLEINNTDQEGYTVRFKEAICYNKKLITNNSNVKKSSYYNEQNIFVFDNIDDINPEWILNECKAEYYYNGEFSPLELVKRIKTKYLEKKDENMVNC